MLMSQQQSQQQQQENIKMLAGSVVHRRHLKRIRSHYQPIDMINGNNMAKKKASTSSNSSNGKQSNNGKDNNTGDVESLDVSDMLKTVSHQKRVLNQKRRHELYQIHKNSQLSQDDYKHFMLVASQANYRKLEHPGYYKQLLTETGRYPQLFFSCIDKDIPRTMPDDHPLQASLKNVLYAYAIRNPSLLYCQGMNYIVGFLLINKFNQQETFWFMVQLVQDIVMPDYFKDLSTISVTVQVFEDIMTEVFPQLAAEMQEVGMESGIFLVGWYICLFTKGFINSVSQHLLQEIVLGSYCYPIGFTLIKISMSILATLFTRQQRFQFQQKDFRSLKQSIQTNVYQISLDQLKKGLDYFQYDYEAYLKLSQIYIKRRQKTFAKALQKQLHQKKLSLPPCNIEKPVCIHRVQIQKKIGTLEEVLILKNDIPISEQLIQNYFPGKVNRGQPKLNYQNPKECPMTHHSHICKISHQAKFMPKKKFAQQNSKYYPVNDGESSIQVQSRFSKIQDRFTQFSSYFIVDQNQSNFYNSPHEDLMELSDGEGHDQVKQQNQGGIKGHLANLNIVISVGNVFRKAIDGIRLLRNGGTTQSTHTYSNKLSQNSP